MKAIIRANSISKGRFSGMLLEFITAVLIVLWIYVGITKLIDHRSVVWQMSTNPVFKSIPILAAFGGPILELIIALLLVIKKTRLIGLYASFILMFFFTVYVTYLMLYLPNLPCSCGGIISELNWQQHLILNILLTILSLVAIILLRKKRRSSIPGK